MEGLGEKHSLCDAQRKFKKSGVEYKISGHGALYLQKKREKAKLLIHFVKF
jgi:hypothetical protein